LRKWTDVSEVCSASITRAMIAGLLPWDYKALHPRKLPSLWQTSLFPYLHRKLYLKFLCSKVIIWWRFVLYIHIFFKQITTDTIIITYLKEVQHFITELDVTNRWSYYYGLNTWRPYYTMARAMVLSYLSVLHNRKIRIVIYPHCVCKLLAMLSSFILKWIHILFLSC
jgi:hypothetical protein